jgi:hypothetical protein
LAQELHRNRAAPASFAAADRFSTSEIVRNLCVFTSNISWVTRPSHGDYNICKDAEQRLSNILDDYLNQTPSSSESTISVDIDSAMFEWVDYGPNLEFGSVLFN